MLPVSRTFWNVVNGKRYSFPWEKRKRMKKASHKNRAIELKVRAIRAAKWLFVQSFLKIIFITVLSTAVF